MTGSTSCYRRRTFGPPLQPGVRSTRKSQRKYSAKSGKGCRPFICGWMSSYGGGCFLTECTSQHLLGNPKQNSMPCSLTKLLDATERTLMKRRGTVEPESKRSEHGGRAVEIGWKAIEPMVNRLSLISRSCWRHYLPRIRQHSWKSISSWRIAQKGGRLKMARIGSNGDVYQMFETRLGILVQTLIWKTSKHGQRGAILLGGRELVRGLRGTRTFHLFHLVCKFPWIFAWFVLWVLLCLVGVLVLLAFAFGEIWVLSSLIPVVDRQCLALVRQCRKKKIRRIW